MRETHAKTREIEALSLLVSHDIEAETHREQMVSRHRTLGSSHRHFQRQRQFKHGNGIGETDLNGRIESRSYSTNSENRSDPQEYITSRSEQKISIHSPQTVHHNIWGKSQEINTGLPIVTSGNDQDTSSGKNNTRQHEMDISCVESELNSLVKCLQSSRKRKHNSTTTTTTIDHHKIGLHTNTQPQPVNVNDRKNCINDRTTFGNDRTTFTNDKTTTNDIARQETSHASSTQQQHPLNNNTFTLPLDRISEVASDDLTRTTESQESVQRDDSPDSKDSEDLKDLEDSENFKDLEDSENLKDSEDMSLESSWSVPSEVKKLLSP